MYLTISFSAPNLPQRCLFYSSPPDVVGRICRICHGERSVRNHVSRPVYQVSSFGLELGNLQQINFYLKLSARHPRPERSLCANQQCTTTMSKSVSWMLNPVPPSPICSLSRRKTLSLITLISTVTWPQKLVKTVSNFEQKIIFNLWNPLINHLLTSKSITSNTQPTYYSRPPTPNYPLVERGTSRRWQQSPCYWYRIRRNRRMRSQMLCDGSRKVPFIQLRQGRQSL